MKKRRRSVLTEKQAWEVLSIIFGDRFGMCYSISQLRIKGLIGNGVLDRMYAVIRKASPDSGRNGYLFEMTHREPDRDRFRFARNQVVYGSARGRAAPTSKRYR